ncbi:FG-GAP repeat protein, partial [Vibrio parahaemolyticus]
MKNILIILLISFTSLSMASYVSVILLNKGDVIINTNKQSLDDSENSEIVKTPTKLQSKIIASDGVSGNHFGSSISMSGDTAIIGTNYKGVGAAYIFKNTGS